MKIHDFQPVSGAPQLKNGAAVRPPRCVHSFSGTSASASGVAFSAVPGRLRRGRILPRRRLMCFSMSCDSSAALAATSSAALGAAACVSSAASGSVSAGANAFYFFWNLLIHGSSRRTRPFRVNKSISHIVANIF